MKYGHVSLWEKQCKEPAEIKFKGIYDRCPRCTYSVFLLPLRCYLAMQTPALRLCFPDPYRISSTSEHGQAAPQTCSCSSDTASGCTLSSFTDTGMDHRCNDLRALQCYPAKSMENTGTKHPNELIHIPVSGYTTHTASVCRTKTFSPSHLYKYKQVFSPNKRKACFARGKDNDSVHKCLLLCSHTHQSEQLRLLRCPLVSSFPSRVLTKNISPQNLLFQGEKRLWQRS